jgi:integrase
MAWIASVRYASGKEYYIIRFEKDGKTSQHSTGIEVNGHKRIPFEVQDIKARIEQTLRQRKFKISVPLKVDQILQLREEHLENLAMIGEYSPRTVQRTKEVHCYFLDFNHEHYPGTKGTPTGSIFEAYAIYRRQHPRSKTKTEVSIDAVNLELRTLKATFNWGAEEGRKICEPIGKKHIRFLKGGNKPPKPMEVVHLNSFFQAIETTKVRIIKHKAFWHLGDRDEEYLRFYWRLLFLTYLLTGERKNEVPNLVWGDVDTANSSFRVDETKTKVDREAYLPAALMELFNTFREMQKRKGFSTNSDQKIFLTSGEANYRVWRYYLKAAGINDPRMQRLHNTRHTFASQAIMLAGASLKDVQLLLGHKSPQATHKYVHLTQRHLAGIVDKLDGALGNLTNSVRRDEELKQITTDS